MTTRNTSASVSKGRKKKPGTGLETKEERAKRKVVKHVKPHKGAK